MTTYFSTAWDILTSERPKECMYTPDWPLNPESIMAIPLNCFGILTGERAKEYMSSFFWPLNPNTLKASMHQSIESICARVF